MTQVRAVAQAFTRSQVVDRDLSASAHRAADREVAVIGHGTAKHPNIVVRPFGPTATNQARLHQLSPIVNRLEGALSFDRQVHLFCEFSPLLNLAHDQVLQRVTPLTEGPHPLLRKRGSDLRCH